MPFEISIYPARHRVHILQERALYVAIAVASSLVITTAISLAIHGSVRADTFSRRSVLPIVSFPMTALFQRLNRELHDALSVSAHW
jgi:signal transduction histidine kinase